MCGSILFMIKNTNKDEFIIRLSGKHKLCVDELLNRGYFTNKSEIVRHGIIEISKKYLPKDNCSQELLLVGNAIKKELDKLNRSGKSLISENDFLKDFPHLKKTK
jgi:Arc/MetJ-type ribon-helix-helix transcriptional regulator